MRKTIGFILILLCSLGVSAQKSNHFKVNAGEGFTSLYPSNGMVRPAAVKPPYDIPISLKEEKKAIRDILDLLKEKFPEVSDKDFGMLRRVTCTIYFSGVGKVIYYYILFPTEYMDSFPRFEKPLYDIVETLSTWDFSKYGLNVYSPDEVSHRIGGIRIPLLWLRSKWENNQ